MNVITCGATTVQDILAEIAKNNNLFFLVVGAADNATATALATSLDATVLAFAVAPLTADVWWLQGDASCLNDPALAGVGLPGPDGTVGYGYGVSHVLARSILQSHLQIGGQVSQDLVDLASDALYFKTSGQQP